MTPPRGLKREREGNKAGKMKNKQQIVGWHFGGIFK